MSGCRGVEPSVHGCCAAIIARLGIGWRHTTFLQWHVDGFQPTLLTISLILITTLPLWRDLIGAAVPKSVPACLEVTESPQGLEDGPHRARGASRDAFFTEAPKTRFQTAKNEACVVSMSFSAPSRATYHQYMQFLRSRIQRPKPSFL
jgi:hypothetical protein